MIGEVNVAGVFIPAILIWALVAMAIGFLVRRILTLIGFYHLVWHRGLFDLALFFILWGSVAFMVNRFGLPGWITR
jgi:hypothetical protein